MKNSNDTIGNRTRDLPACSAVPQPITLPRLISRYDSKFTKKKSRYIPQLLWLHNGVMYGELMGWHWNTQLI